MRVALLAAAALAVASLSSLGAQNAARPTPTFEVASIKRSAPDARGWTYGWRPGGRWEMRNLPVSTLIREAYPAQTRELIGAPEWAADAPYDVNAQGPLDATVDERREMLQGLLAERFSFKAHYESRDRPVWALEVARADGRLGPDIKASSLDCVAVQAARREGKAPPGPPPSNGAPPCGWSMEGGGPIRFGGVPLSRLSQILGEPDGRPIIDRTNVPGLYEGTVLHDQGVRRDDVPTLFTALQEQLGLKLVSARAPVQVLVVDRVERPTED